jgi:hypothetical protein
VITLIKLIDIKVRVHFDGFSLGFGKIEAPKIMGRKSAGKNGKHWAKLFASGVWDWYCESCGGRRYFSREDCLRPATFSHYFQLQITL